jgi:crotonobetainyl-CoA:carnitine CoA-transferase CaiB-like acyl-CoA transferase
VGAANQENWLRLVGVLEAPELRDDPRFANNAQRMTNLFVLVDALTPLFKRRTMADWLARLESAGVPAGPVLDIAQMHADPQAIAREMIVETLHPVAGPVKAIGLPIKFSDTPGGVHRPAPVFGEHTREVLREQNYSEKEIDNMLDGGAVQAPDSTKKGATR